MAKKRNRNKQTRSKKQSVPAKQTPAQAPPPAPKDDGFEELDADDLIRLRIHGLDDILRKRKPRRRRS